MEDALFLYATETFPLAAMARDARGKRDEREAVHMSVVIHAQSGVDHSSGAAPGRGGDTALLSWAEHAYPLREIVGAVVRNAGPNANVREPFLVAMLKRAEHHSPGVSARAVDDANSRIPGFRRVDRSRPGATVRPEYRSPGVTAPSVSAREYAESKFRAICVDAVEYIPTSRPYDPATDKKRIRGIVNRKVMQCAAKTSKDTAAVREVARGHLGYPPRAEHVAGLFRYVWETYDLERLSAPPATPETLESALRASITRTNLDCHGQSSSCTVL